MILKLINALLKRLNALIHAPFGGASDFAAVVPNTNNIDLAVKQQTVNLSAKYRSEYILRGWRLTVEDSILENGDVASLIARWLVMLKDLQSFLNTPQRLLQEDEIQQILSVFADLSHSNVFSPPESFITL